MTYSTGGMELRAPHYVVVSLPGSSLLRNKRYAVQNAVHRPSGDRFTLQCSPSPLTKTATEAPGLLEEVRTPEEAPRAEDEEQAMLEALRMWKTKAAWTRFEELRKLGVLPDRVCISRLIAQLCHLGTASSISKAQQVMLDVEKLDRVSQLVDADAMGLLVMATARTGTPRYALRILRLMLGLGLYPPVKVWSAVVAKLGQSLDDAQMAVDVYDEVCQLIVEKGIVQLQRQMKLDESEAQMDVTLPEKTQRPVEEDVILYSPAVPIKPTISTRNTNPDSTSIVEVTEKDIEIALEERQSLLKMKPDTGAFNAVLNACANIGAFQKAEELWKLMEAFRVKPNTLTFNIMIKLHARVQNLSSLLRILQTMEEAEVSPDITTFNSLVAAFVGLGEMNQAEYIIRILRGEIKPEKDHGNELKLLQKQKFQPDVRMYTTLMKGYVQQNRVSDAVQLLVAMQENSKSLSPPNEFTFTTAIRACAKMGLIKEARTILQEMSRQGVAANIVTYNTLLQGVCAFPDMEQAMEIVEDMKVAGVDLDVVSYNTLINGYLEADDNVQALAVFNKMRRAKIAASKVTYGTLMKAFGRSGHTELVAKVFTEMAKDPRVRIDVVAWNTLIDAYAKAGLDQDAVRSLQEMKDRGFHPTNATYCTLVKGFVKSRNYGQLIILWNEIKRRSIDEDNAAIKNEPVVIGALKPDAALLDSLIDAFVRGGYFQLALQVVDCMDRQGIRTAKTKAKYKRLYVELYANLYTSRHTSERTKAKTGERRRAVEAFKFWVGLPNDLYKSEWRPFEN